MGASDIEKVLHAERRAEETVVAAQRSAEATRMRARERARRIAELADLRIARLNQRCSAAADRKIAGLREEFDRRAATMRPGTIAADRSRRAASRVADWLLGADEEIKRQ